MQSREHETGLAEVEVEIPREYVPMRRYRIVVSGIVDARTPQAAQEKFKLATGLRALILRPNGVELDEYSVSTVEMGGK